MELEGKTILVVGGGGLIGSHLVDALVETPVREIRVFDNFTRGSEENLRDACKDDRVRIWPDRGDILQRDVLDAAMKDVDGVFHLAALWLLHCRDYPEAAFETNVRGTFQVIQAAIRAGVQRFIYSSSASVYGNALETPMTEEHPYNNDTFYGATKIAGEHLLKALATQHGLSWAGLRYMNVYGPRQDYRGAYTAVMHKMIDLILDGEAPVVYGDGKQTYDFIHVRDVARANLRAMQAEADGFYNVGCGAGTSIRELAGLLLELAGSEQSPRFEADGPTFVTHRIGSTERAEQELGFRTEIGLEEGMRELLDWRRAQGRG